MNSSESYKDKELLREIANGNETAFRQLMRDYHSLSYTIASKVLQEDWMAEDIVQEVFLKVWLHREQLAAIDNFGAWLRTVTANTLYDYLKKKKAETNRIQNWWAEARHSSLSLTSATAGEQELLALIDLAVDKLSPRQQQVFRLIKQEGYSRNETARLINISPDTVKTHLEQAMRSVRAFCLSKLDPSTFALLICLFSEKKF